MKLLLAGNGCPTMVGAHEEAVEASTRPWPVAASEAQLSTDAPRRAQARAAAADFAPCAGWRAAPPLSGALRCCLPTMHKQHCKRTSLPSVLHTCVQKGLREAVQRSTILVVQNGPLTAAIDVVFKLKSCGIEANILKLTALAAGRSFESQYGHLTTTTGLA
jgi:hypothetical protein